jgi:hypothetical protein
MKRILSFLAVRNEQGQDPYKRFGTTRVVSSTDCCIKVMSVTADRFVQWSFAGETSTRLPKHQGSLQIKQVQVGFEHSMNEAKHFSFLFQHLQPAQSRAS